MPLNKACIGRQYPPIQNVVTVEAIQKFARAYNHANPFFFDASKAGAILAPPMFGVTWVVPATERVVDHDAELQVDTLHLVHGEQELEFVRLVSPSEVIATTATITSIETKATGEILGVESTSRDRNGEIVQRAVFSAFIRSGGSGRPGSAASQSEAGHNDPPLFTHREETTKEMPRDYAEAAEDWHQIHLDPQAAAMAGLPGVILHGLCTLALCSKPFIERLIRRRSAPAQAAARPLHTAGFSWSTHRHQGMDGRRTRRQRSLRLRGDRSGRPGSHQERNR